MNCFSAYLDTMYEQVDPHEFYRDVFPAGSLQKTGEYEQGKYNGIYVALTDRKRKKKLKDGRVRDMPIVQRYTLTDDLDCLDTALNSDYFCLCAPIAYAGKTRSSENARLLFGIAIDLDHIRTRDEVIPVGLISLMVRHVPQMRVPEPTYIVSSGTGLHLYYLFERPLPLYPAFSRSLEEYKRALTKLIWHDTIVDIKSEKDIQYESIFQGFRMPGTRTKVGKDDRAVAYRVGSRVTMEYLNGFVPASKRAVLQYEAKYTLEQAKKLYPEWYERRVVEGNRERIIRPWCVNRRVYDWWKDKIYDGAVVGHRYWCIWILAVYAQKCSHYDAKKNPNPVTIDELDEDAYGFKERMDSLTVDENNHFTEDDILAALEGYQDSLNTYPLSSIEYHSAIHIERNKRNKRKQVEHLDRARWLQLYDDPDGNWRNKEGRPTAEMMIREYLDHHPDCKKADIVRDLKLSKPTVYKWWGVIRNSRVVEKKTAGIQQLSPDEIALISRMQDGKIIMNQSDPDLLEKMKPYMPDKLDQLRVVPEDEYKAMERILIYYEDIIEAQIQ